MTTYKCKHKINRLERETYLFRTENHILLLNLRRTPIKSLGSAQKVGLVGLEKTNNLLLRLNGVSKRSPYDM